MVNQSKPPDCEVGSRQTDDGGSSRNLSSDADIAVREHEVSELAEMQSEQTGVVVIGRNEGRRLISCLDSLFEEKPGQVVYVDSGSTDGSPQAATDRGASVVHLDLTQPFTAARARNAGFRDLVHDSPWIEFIQFVDGDCTMHSSWLNVATRFLSGRPDVAVVCGSLRELAPERSVFNRLCAMEWKASVGEVRSCGGIFMIRSQAFADAGGFRETLIAGEEPELCQRLRDSGWKINRIASPMATHDAAMTQFSQWWKRSVRGGHAYAEDAWIHRQSLERPWRREVVRNYFWGLGFPIAVIAFAFLKNGLGLTLFGLYPVWMWRIARLRTGQYSEPPRDAWTYAFFCMLGKLPAALGQLLFRWRRFIGKNAHIIEYKPKST